MSSRHQLSQLMEISQREPLALEPSAMEPLAMELLVMVDSIGDLESRKESRQCSEQVKSTYEVCTLFTLYKFNKKMITKTKSIRLFLHSNR